MPSSNRTENEIQLRILATSDLHATLRGFDYCSEMPLPGLGLDGAAALIGQLRRQVRNSLLVDNGDFLQGNPLADLFAEPVRDRLHPVVAAMNKLGYDAAALGNHEFNYGLPALRHAIAGARFPILCANIAMLGGELPVASTHILLERNMLFPSGRQQPLRIGLFGLIPPQVKIWDRRNLEGRIEVTDMVDAARVTIAALRAEGADLVIALCHSGIGSTNAPTGSENMAGQVAALDGLDAIVAGHSHDVFPATPSLSEGTVPMVLPGCFASHVGLIDLRLRQNDDGRWLSRGCAAALRVADHVGPRNLRLSPEAQAVRKASAAAHRATRLKVRRPVGRTDVPLTSHLAALPGNAALAIIAESQAAHVAAALRGTPFERLPLLSAAAPFKFGGRGGAAHYTNVAPGPLAIRNVADLYIHPNRIAAVVVTGTELKAWLEKSAEFFLRVVPGQANQPLLNPDIHASDFDVIHGVDYQIDLSASCGKRVVGLSFGEDRVEPAKRYVVATNSYRAEGGGDFPGAQPANIVLEDRIMVQDVLREHIEHVGTIRGPRHYPFAFRTLPGTSVLLETAKAVRAELPCRTDLALEDLGEGGEGLVRLRLRL
ncbi:5'-nucleotidase C-terminal domain-containing protein [Tabrizicola sp. J26]|uniref:5'-nucleotidase C-terminal domain-containing protein n=1 Tax=Alitabrizicola rongguiensis TaxID=2909234 RepID=UPI001F47A466|nr:5'-nucleotidase C-terminal domain-containing protein [Tabrizicola rongguiensis]MCF1707628.1 5'-nucleotidase C-terminal domain-containing protein [Tabrizicola rongguiensis]